MKNKSVQNCQFVHHAKFQCIMTTLKKLFKIEFDMCGRNWKKPTARIRAKPWMFRLPFKVYEAVIILEKQML